MKTIVSILLIASLLFSCKNKSDNTNVETIDHLENTEKNNALLGAWELVGYYNYVDNEVTDSFQTSEGYRQVKIYTNSKVMWSKYVPSDSSEWFGYGSYKISEGELIEVLEYGSEMMSRIIEEKKEFKHELIIKGDAFSQIEIDDDGNRLYAENYRRIE